MISGPALLDALRQHRLIDEDDLDRLELERDQLPANAQSLSAVLIQQKLLTPFQASRLLSGEGAELSLGQHVLLDQLGEGGMGQVFKARHRLLRRIDAIKIIRAECLTSKLAVKRFYQESEAVARLSHPNIVKAHDANREGDRHYFVMEYVAGVDLANLLAQRGPLPVALASEYIRQAALGLQHAHEKKLVHRDIKPSNLLLSQEDGLIKLLDLGLAQLRNTSLAEDDPKGRPLTPHGMIMGTPDYMAPEQAENSSTVDIRADIYSLGCTFYHLLAGDVPYPGGTLVDKLSKHSVAPPPPLRAVRSEAPPALQVVLDRMMAKSRSDRYQQPIQIAQALAAFAAEAAPPTWITPGPSDSAVNSSVPPTLHLPASGAPAVVKPPSRKTDPIPPGVAHVAPDSAPTIQVGTPRQPSPVTAPRKRRLLLPAAMVLLLAGVVAAAVTFWPRDHEPDRPPMDGNKDADQHVKVDDRGATENKSPKDRPADRDRKTDRDTPKDRPPDRDKKTEPPPKDNTSASKDGSTPPPPVEKFPRAKPGPETGIVPGVEVKVAPQEKPAVARGVDWQRLGPAVELKLTPQSAVFNTPASQLLLRADERVQVVDVPAGTNRLERSLLEPLRELNYLGKQPLGAPLMLSSSGAQVWYVVVSPTDWDRKRSLTTAYDTVCRWDGQRLVRYHGGVPTGAALSPLTVALALTPSEKVLITGTRQKLYRVDLEQPGDNFEIKLSMSLNDDLVCLASSAQHVAAATADRKVSLYRADLDSDRPLAEMEGHEGKITQMAFLGENLLLSGDSKGEVFLWDVKPADKPVRGPALLKSPGTGAVTTLAASADGRHFAIGWENGAISVGDATAKESRELAGPPPATASVLALAFARDGAKLHFVRGNRLGVLQLTPPTVAEAKRSAAAEQDRSESKPWQDSPK